MLIIRQLVGHLQVLGFLTLVFLLALRRARGYAGADRTCGGGSFFEELIDFFFVDALPLIGRDLQLYFRLEFAVYLIGRVYIRPGSIPSLSSWSIEFENAERLFLLWSETMD